MCQKYNCALYIHVCCSFSAVWLLHTLRRSCTMWILRLWFVFKGYNLHGLGQPSVWACWKLYHSVFSDTINVINVKLWTMVLHFELCLIITLSVILTLFQGHSSIKQFYFKILCTYPIKLKLCRIVKYIKQVMNIPLCLTFANMQER